MPSDPGSRNGSAPSSTTPTIQRVIVVGYILAVAIPPVGLIIGLVLMVRVKSRHGLWIVLATVIGVLIWIVVVNSGTLNSTNQSY